MTIPVFIIILIVALLTACGEVSYDPGTHETTFETYKVSKPVEGAPR